jgi:hypothetical protein
MLCHGFDKRTIKTWFDALWKLEYLTQPQPGVFNLNVNKIAKLELPAPRQIDLKQKRLGAFLE